MISLGIKIENGHVMPTLKVNGQNSLSIKEIAILLHMMDSGIYAGLLWDELSNSIETKHLESIKGLLVTIKDKTVTKFSLVDYLSHSSINLLEEAMIPIVDNEVVNE